MGTPWYLPVDEAAKVTGLSTKLLRGYVNSSDPPPHLMSGRKRLLNMEALRAYLKAREA